MNSKLTTALLGLIAILSAANLGVTLWQGGQSGSPQQITTSATKSLPMELVHTKLQPVTEAFLKSWNAENYAEIWQLFDPFAQVQMERNGAISQLRKLRDLAGPLRDAVYSHQEFMMHNNGRDFFRIIYKTRYIDRPEKGAEIFIDVFYVDGVTGVFAIKISL